MTRQNKKNGIKFELAESDKSIKTKKVVLTSAGNLQLTVKYRLEEFLVP